jgi:hypothetical protein
LEIGNVGDFVIVLVQMVWRDIVSTDFEMLRSANKNVRGYPWSEYRFRDFVTK